MTAMAPRPTPPGFLLPPDDSGRWALFLTIGLIGVGVVAALYLLLGRVLHANDAAAARAEERAADERVAREWADKLGRRVTGVSCAVSGRCTVAFVDGPPVDVVCFDRGCVLTGCR